MNWLYKYNHFIVFGVFLFLFSGLQNNVYGEAPNYIVVPFADQYWLQTGPYPTAYSNVGNFFIIETDKKGFNQNQNGSIVITLPTGFEFNTSANHMVTFSKTKDITNITLNSVSKSQITITISTDSSESEIDSILFYDFEIRAVTAGNSGNMLRLDGAGGNFKIDNSKDKPTNNESLGYLQADSGIKGVINDSVEDKDFVEDLLMMLESDDVWGEDPPDSKELPIIQKAISQIEDRIENKKNEINKLESMLQKSQTPDEAVSLILAIDSKKKSAAIIENNLVSVIDNLEEQGTNSEDIKNNAEVYELEKQQKEKTSEIANLERELDNSYIPDSIVKLVIVIDEKKQELTVLKKQLRRTKAQESAIIKIAKETEAYDKESDITAQKHMEPESVIVKDTLSSTPDQDISELKGTLTSEKYLIMENVLFGFDKSNLSRESFPELNKLAKHLIKNPDIEVEIGGHTDHKGSESYNLILSKRRSQSVADYLISKSIDLKRIAVKGYGESKPIAPNTLIDGKDNPAGRKLNRRTEIKIIL